MENKSAIVNYPESNIVALERQFFGDSEKKTDVFEIERIFKILQRYKYLILVFIVLGAIGGYFIASNKISLYRSSVNIVVEPESSDSSQYLSNIYRYYIPQAFYETQRAVMKSNVVLEHAARSLSPQIVEKLFYRPAAHWTTNYLNEIKSNIVSFVGLAESKNEAFDQSVQLSQGTPTKKYSIKQIAKNIQSKISISFGITNQLLNLRTVSNDPMVAAVVSNTVAESYISYLLENRVSQTERTGQWLADKIEASRERLSDAENALSEFQVREKLLDLGTVKSLSSVRVGGANSRLFEAEQNYVALSKRYGAKHPTLIEAKKELNTARSLFGSESSADLSSNEGEFELGKLERAINSNRELYELFLFRFNEVELGLNAVSSNTMILDRAGIPSVPFSPDIKQQTIKGAIVGLLIALIILIGREIMDRTYKNQSDVEERLQLPVLGVLPLLETGKIRKKIERIIPERHYHRNAKSNFAEVVNHVRTGVIYSNVDNPPKVILITSALPKEGKTTCATNLSLAFSKLGKTLLIDADFRKPRIAKIANIDNTKGLTGYVAGQNTLKECLFQDEDSDNLFVMKSGEVPPNPLELISSNRFSETLELMKTNFDYILIDSAPIIPVSDGIVLGKLSDAIIMIIKAGSTTHNISQTAMKRFSSANLKPTGVVLSQLDYKSSNYYYGKYDYYTKDYYS